MYCTFIPTILFLLGRVAGMVYIQLSHNHQQYLLIIQQSTMFTLVMGLIMAGRRPMSTFPFNMNYSSSILRRRVAGLLWPISTSNNISSVITRGRVTGQTWPTSIISAITWGIFYGLLRPMFMTFTTPMITWGIVAGLKRHTSTTFISRRCFHFFFFRTFNIAVTTTGGRMADLMRPKCYNLISPHCE